MRSNHEVLSQPRGAIRAFAALALALFVTSGCATDDENDTVVLVEEGGAATLGQTSNVVEVSPGALAELTLDSPGVLDIDRNQVVVSTESLDRLIGVSDAKGSTTKALCVRTPLGPGEVKWTFNVDGSVWRSKPENSRNWVGARRGTQDTDGVHKNGWGCNAYKIPNYCTATVSSNGNISCCCNAVFEAADGGCRWVHATGSDLGAAAPPGCR